MILSGDSIRNNLVAECVEERAKMRLLQASKCCFCANLRLGGLIIGYIYLILSILHAPAVGKFGILTCSKCAFFRITCVFYWNGATKKLIRFFFFGKIIFLTPYFSVTNVHIRLDEKKKTFFFVAPLRKWFCRFLRRIKWNHLLKCFSNWCDGVQCLAVWHLSGKFNRLTITINFNAIRMWITWKIYWRAIVFSNSVSLCLLLLCIGYQW